ncbi:P-loop containing nucleoside triphosphate hydrolase protein [Crassisporium funariophilum]|nr:P-loop containing nucleoside triphosphate hydrolase protein [Crassisporium funariophilum]
MASTNPPVSRNWSVKDIRDLVQAKFGKRPCWFQIRTTMALRAGKDVTGIAATGAGKTLSFWIPLLMALEEGQDKMVVIVTPLNLLGKQTEAQLNKAAISCVAVDKQTNKPETYKDIKEGKHRVITISPELLNETPCRELLEDPKVASKLLYFVSNEGHCVSQWGHTFRDQYLYVGSLRYSVPSASQVPFYVASATLPPDILQDVTHILRLRPDKTVFVHCSNDRPNIHLVVRPMAHPVKSYHDLAFLIPNNFTVDSPRFPKFLVFFDSTTSSEDAIRYLRTRLPPELRDKITWFHSTMTSAYREEEFDCFASDEVWGLAVTDAFGMGLDLPDVQIVVQYRVPSDMCTLWQRFGRSGRAAGSEAIAILLAEKKHFDKDREKRKAANRVRRGQRAAKRKAPAQCAPPAAKRPALGPATNLVGHLVDTTEAVEEEPLDSDGDSNELDELSLARQPQSSVPAAKERVLELGSALDDFINADTRCIKCRRTVSDLYFRNGKASNDFHLLCDDTHEGGCNRCSRKATRLCCDLCNPESFSSVAPIAIEKPGRTLKRSNIKPYEATENDRRLRAELITWRDEQAPKALGDATFDEWGPFFFMSDETLQRIVDCAHGGKLPDINAVRRETHWREDRIKEYGASLFAIIEQSSPAPNATASTRGPRLCSVCKQPGHTRASTRCPTRIAALSATLFSPHQDRENIPLLPPILSPYHISQALNSQFSPSPSRLPLARQYARSFPPP